MSRLSIPKPPKPDELKKQVQDNVVWTSIFRPGSIYRKGHPALAKPHRPSHANSGAALLARAMKAL